MYDKSKSFSPAYIAAAKTLFGAGAMSYSAGNRYLNNAMANSIGARSGGPNVVTTRVRRPMRGSRRSFAARVRSVAPYKHNTINDSTNTSGMLSNNIYTNSLTTKIIQGDTNAQRTGDAVQLVALKIKGVINTPTTAGAYGYRVLVGYSTKQFNVSGSTSGLTATDIFLPSSGTLWQPGAIVNPKAFTVLHDSVIDINSLVTATADLAQVDIKVPVTGKFDYISDGSVYGKTRNLYMIVIAAVVGGSSGITACGTYALNTDLIFQDI